MRKKYLYRVILYLSGLLILSLGLTLNTKTGLGVSPIISVSYCISTIFHQNFGNITFILYGCFVITEMLLHTVRNHRYARHAGTVLVHASRINQRLTLLMDFLQLPFSLVITRLLNLFNDILPDFPSPSEYFSEYRSAQGLFCHDWPHRKPPGWCQPDPPRALPDSCAW